MPHNRLSADGASVAANHLPQMSHLGWSARYGE
jgi:hypothetical protein